MENKGVKAEVGRSQFADDRRAALIDAAERDVKSCQHAVEKTQTAIADQQEALGHAQVQLAEAEARLKARTDAAPDDPMFIPPVRDEAAELAAQIEQQSEALAASQARLQELKKPQE